MNETKWLLIVIVVAAFGTAGCRGAEATREASPTASGASSATIVAGSSVVLVANMAEADDECGCGQIIRAVRAVAQKGVATKEVDTRTNKDEAKKYRALVAPTVLVLDPSGAELRRWEGESDDTIKKMKTDLDMLASAKK